MLDRFARVLKLSNDPSPGYNIEQLAKKSVTQRLPCRVSCVFGAACMLGSFRNVRLSISRSAERRLFG